MRRLLVVTLVAAIALPAAVAVTTGAAAVKTHRAACPSAARIAQLSRWSPGGVVRADIDGDGRSDKVTIRLDRSAPARCAFYLRVATSRRAYNRGLGQLISGSVGRMDWNSPVRSWQYLVPVVEAVVHLGGRGNLIALGANHGASDLFVDFLGLSHGKLRVFPFGLEFGSGAMTQKGASCTRRGAVREWAFGPASSRKHPNRWAYSVATSRRHGWRMNAVSHRTVRGSEKSVTRAAGRAGVPSGALAGCVIVRNGDFD